MYQRDQNRILECSTVDEENTVKLLHEKKKKNATRINKVYYKAYLIFVFTETSQL